MIVDIRFVRHNIKLEINFIFIIYAWVNDFSYLTFECIPYSNISKLGYIYY